MAVSPSVPVSSSCEDSRVELKSTPATHLTSTTTLSPTRVASRDPGFGQNVGGTQLSPHGHPGGRGPVEHLAQGPKDLHCPLWALDWPRVVLASLPHARAFPAGSVPGTGHRPCRRRCVLSGLGKEGLCVGEARTPGPWQERLGQAASETGASPVPPQLPHPLQAPGTLSAVGRAAGLCASSPCGPGPGRGLGI